jgi:hypothetical protein
MCVTYIYCDYQYGEQQTPVNMNGSMLNQIIIEHTNQIPDEVLNSLKMHRDRRTVLDLEISYKLLESALQNFQGFFLRIDGLDELRDQHRRDFLRSVTNLVSRFKDSARIFATGRPYIENVVEGFFKAQTYIISLKAAPGDIEAYVAYQLEMDGNFDDMDDYFKTKIINRIVEAADGMFVMKLPCY